MNRRSRNLGNTRPPHDFGTCSCDCCQTRRPCLATVWVRAIICLCRTYTAVHRKQFRVFWPRGGGYRVSKCAAFASTPFVRVYAALSHAHRVCSVGDTGRPPKGVRAASAAQPLRRRQQGPGALAYLPAASSMVFLRVAALSCVRCTGLGSFVSDRDRACTVYSKPLHGSFESAIAGQPCMLSSMGGAGAVDLPSW